MKDCLWCACVVDVVACVLWSEGLYDNVKIKGIVPVELFTYIGLVSGVDHIAAVRGGLISLGTVMMSCRGVFPEVVHGERCLVLCCKW